MQPSDDRPAGATRPTLLADGLAAEAATSRPSLLSDAPLADAEKSRILSNLESDSGARAPVKLAPSRSTALWTGVAGLLVLIAGTGLWVAAESATDQKLASFPIAAPAVVPATTSAAATPVASQPAVQLASAEPVGAGAAVVNDLMPAPPASVALAAASAAATKQALNQMLSEGAGPAPARKPKASAHSNALAKGKADTRVRLASHQAKKVLRQGSKGTAVAQDTRLAAKAPARSKSRKDTAAQEDSDVALLAALIAHSQNSGATAKSSLLARDQYKDNVK